MRFAHRPLVALLLAAASLSCSAAAVTFSFTGAVTSDPFGLSSTGAPISGSFTFDPQAADAVAGAALGSYPSSGMAFGFGVEVDGSEFGVPGTLTVNVADNIGVDQYGVIAQDDLLTLELFFEDATQTALSGDALPVAPPPLSAFAFRQFRLFGPDVEFLGSVDSLRCVAGCEPPGPLPEPAPLLLVAAALAAAALRRGRPILAAPR